MENSDGNTNTAVDDSEVILKKLALGVKCNMLVDLTERVRTSFKLVEPLVCRHKGRRLTGLGEANALHR